MHQGVVHGRFQPLHLGHMKYILTAMDRVQFLYVGITNPDPILTRDDPADALRSRSSANPCMYYERLLMVRGALFDAGFGPDTFCVVPFPISMPEILHYYTPQDAVYFLTIYDEWGERKLNLLKSCNLSTNILWRRSKLEKGITGAEVRFKMYAGEPWKHLVPDATIEIVERFNIEKRIRDLLGQEQMS